MNMRIDYPWDRAPHWTARYGPPTDAGLVPLPLPEEDVLRRALATTITESGRCAVCGSEDNDEHMSRPHCFEDQDVVEVFRAAVIEARR